MPVPFPRYWLLNTGSRMPNLGFGTYQAVGDILKEAVDCALSVGYKHIDTARIYENEQDIGDVLHSRFKIGLKRKDIFVTTKIPPVFLAEEDVWPCLEASLSDMKLTYVDMLLIHSPFGLRNHGDGNLRPKNELGNPDNFHHNLLRTWKAMEMLVKERKVRAIGLSNFTPRQINKIWYHAEIKPANLQLECHAYNQQQELLHYCDARDIRVTGYSPLGAPGLPEHHKAGRQLPSLIDDPVVTGIAQSIQKSNAQVLLRFLLQLGVVPLPKSVSKSRIEENIKIYDFVLESHDMIKLKELHRHVKYFMFDSARSHPEYYHDEPF